MKIRAIVTTIAAGLLTAALVPASSAQEINSSAPDGIEVITITAKRPAPTVASICVNEVLARAANQHTDGNFSGDTQDLRRANLSSMRQDIRRCIEQASVPATTRI